MSVLKSDLVRPGDIVFVDGQGWLDGVIEWFQTLRGHSGTWSRWSHAGVVLDGLGRILETTSWRTSDKRSLAEHYAGSRLRIVRWPCMDERLAVAAHGSLSGQVGRIYPYWRLLAHAVGAERWAHGRAMECGALAAHFLAASGFSLLETPWSYSPDKLESEMAAMGCETVFSGSLRAAGNIQES